MYRFALMVLWLGPMSAAIADDVPVYTKKMLREDVSSPGTSISFPQDEQQPEGKKGKLPTFAGVPIKRVKSCKSRNDIFGDRCYFPDPVEQPSRAFYDNIAPILW